MNIETEGQAASWYHGQILRIQHGKRNYEKRYLTDEQVLDLFNGEVVVEEKVDGKLKANTMKNYPQQKEFWMAEEIYSKTTVHDHIIKYTNAPHHIWLNSVLIVDGEPSVGRIQGCTNSLIYGTINIPDPTIGQIHMLLEAYARLSSHFGSLKIEGLVLKNYKKQKFGKWINEEFEDKIRESEII